MIKIIIPFLALAFASSVSAQNTDQEIWIDVRSTEEYQQEHLKDAINIPFTEIKQRISEITEDKQATIHLYCVAGVRAKIAMTSLQSLGYGNVINEGGLKDIKKN